MEVDLIIIHIGTIYPVHLDLCIKRILTQPNVKLHLIISESLIDSVTSKDIKISKVEDYINNNYLNFKINNYDLNFRDGFWQSTSSRFLILDEYVRRLRINSFFHIEHDNLIFGDLLYLKEKLISIKKNMFIVVDSESRAIPSIIFINDNKILSEFCDFMMINQDKNDMKNLFNFFILNDNVDNLPIIPTNYEYQLLSRIGERPSGKINYCNHYELLNCIFDGAAIGQYIGGVDPRNQDGDTRGFINETTIFDVSKNNYNKVNGEYFMVHHNRLIKITNLHVHSKNLEYF